MRDEADSDLGLNPESLLWFQYSLTELTGQPRRSLAPEQE